MPRRKKASASTSAHGTTIKAVSQASAGVISKDERSLVWDKIGYRIQRSAAKTPPSTGISDFDVGYCAALISLTIFE
ncbi:hypothetical protein [Mesorhizobium sp. M0130]|uniref:hypothetical protein n=1 Tax=Mesorhizobium sp. M0130 TaxID=2956887 RepID=UPI003335AF16